MKCHVCETTEAYSYYTPKDFGGLTMCPECVKYSVYLIHNPHQTLEKRIKVLRQIKEEYYDKPRRRKEDVMVLKKIMDK